MSQGSRLILLSFTFFILFATWIRIFATGPFSPGAQLDPDCAPGESGCTVTPTSIGGTINSATAGSVLFAGTSGVLAQNNSKFFWDNSGNGKLYVGTNTGTTTGILHVEGSTYIKATENSPAFFVVSDSGGRGLIMSALTNNNGGISPTSYGVQINVQEGATTVNTLSSYSNLNTGATANLYINATNVGIGDGTPTALFTVGSGDLFQVNSSGAIAAAVGITSTGAAVNLNVSSNFATNINTGTSSGAISIGGGANTVAVNSTSWDVSTGGAISGLTGITSSGTITFSGLSAAGPGSLNVCISSGVLSFGADCSISSSRFKHNIENLTSSLDKVIALRPVSFMYNETNVPDIGFLAEEVNNIEPRLVFYEPDGVTPRGLRYDKFVSLLAGSIQELNLKVEGIANLQTDSTFIGMLREWLASTANGIVNIFAKKVQTDELCVGATCITEDQLKTILNSQNIPIPVSNPVIPEVIDPLVVEDSDDPPLADVPIPDNPILTPDPFPEITP